MAESSRIGRLSIVVLLVLDAFCVAAVMRLPNRLELPELPSAVPNAAPGLAVVTDHEARFVVSEPYGSGETVLVRVPLDGGGLDAPRAIVQQVGHDLALLEPVRGLDAFLPSGPRFAWSGRTLVIAAPSRRLGVRQITVAAVGGQGLVEPVHTIEGSRPSVGWARDRFEVGYVTPAPPPEPGRVEWIADVDEHGTVSRDRIVEPSGQAHDPFVWPGGVRTHTSGAEPNQVQLQDGSVVSLARVEGDRSRPFFVLRADGGIESRSVRSRSLGGSEVAGDYTVRARWGTDTTLEAHLGARVARPHYILTHRGQRRAFEATVDARVADMIAIERGGVLHLIDPRGFHARFRASDLVPLDRRTGRVAWLVGALGLGPFGLLVAAMVLAHAMGLVVERVARSGGGAKRFGTLAGLTAISLVAGVLYVLWVQ